MDRSTHGESVSAALKQLQLPFDVAPAPTRAGRLRHVQLAGGILGYRLVRASRRGIALFVGADGVEARAPHRAAIADVEDFLRKKERWIRRLLAEPRRPPFVWEAGASLPWLGGALALTLQRGHSEVRMSEGRLEFGIDDGASLRERALEWMCGRALAFFRERTAALSPRLGLDASSVALSNAKTRWGSCGPDGRVLLNWRLMLFPPRLIDYVVVHELAHRLEFNHSARFWEIVARVCPGHLSTRRELNALARNLPEL